MSEGRLELDAAPPEEPGMLMTSMIDVIFILLAFFVCVSEIKKSKLQVNLPHVPAPHVKAEASRHQPLRVEVTRQNRVYVDGKEARDDADLARLLRARARAVGTRVPVRLSGDKDARNGTMMQVVGQLSRVGFKRIEFAVEAGS